MIKKGGAKTKDSLDRFNLYYEDIPIKKTKYQTTNNVSLVWFLLWHTIRALGFVFQLCKDFARFAVSGIWV